MLNPKSELQSSSHLTSPLCRTGQWHPHLPGLHSTGFPFTYLVAPCPSPSKAGQEPLLKYILIHGFMPTLCISSPDPRVHQTELSTEVTSGPLKPIRPKLIKVTPSASPQNERSSQAFLILLPLLPSPVVSSSEMALKSSSHSIPTTQPFAAKLNFKCLLLTVSLIAKRWFPHFPPWALPGTEKVIHN